MFISPTDKADDYSNICQGIPKKIESNAKDLLNLFKQDQVALGFTDQKSQIQQQLHQVVDAVYGIADEMPILKQESDYTKNQIYQLNLIFATCIEFSKICQYGL